MKVTKRGCKKIIEIDTEDYLKKKKIKSMLEIVTGLCLKKANKKERINERIQKNQSSNVLKKLKKKMMS